MSVNSTRFFNGTFPPEDVFEPIGPTLAVHVYEDAQGNRTEGNVLLTDGAVQAYKCPSFVVLRCGPTCKMGYIRGDVVYIPPEVQLPVVRVDGWQVLLVHEERTMGRSPKLNLFRDEFFSKLPKGCTFETMRDGKRRYDVDDEADTDAVKRLDPLGVVVVRRKG
jgi:hypothetical protein